MAFADEVFAVFEKYKVPLQPHLALQLSQLAPAVPTADTKAPANAGNGFMALMGVTNPHYASATHQIKENSDALPAGTFERASAELNLSYANGEWITAQFIGEGVAIEQYHNDVTGQSDYRIKQPVQTLPNTFNWPPVVHMGHDLSTVAGVVAYVNSLG